jgi:hypothetical protein
MAATRLCGRLPSGANSSMTKHVISSFRPGREWNRSECWRLSRHQPASDRPLRSGQRLAAWRLRRGCDPVRCVVQSSNTTRSPVRTAVAVMLSRTAPLLRMSKSTSRRDISQLVPTGRRSFDFTVCAMCDADGKVVACTRSRRHPGRREAEEQLRQAQKMGRSRSGQPQTPSRPSRAPPRLHESPVSDSKS